MAAVLHELGVGGVDGMLLDLGVSSPQLDDAARGFSFRFDGPLDMRMDTSRGPTAAQWLATASENQIGEVIKTYGEERFAKQIARAIVAARSRGAVDTTRQLAQIVGQAVRTREPGQDPATRTFQALRIFVNQELEELSLALPGCARPAQGRRAAGGHQLPFAGGPHRQALHARQLAAARAAEGPGGARVGAPAAEAAPGRQADAAEAQARSPRTRAAAARSCAWRARGLDEAPA